MQGIKRATEDDYNKRAEGRKAMVRSRLGNINLFGGCNKKMDENRRLMGPRSLTKRNLSYYVYI